MSVSLPPFIVASGHVAFSIRFVSYWYACVTPEHQKCMYDALTADYDVIMTVIPRHVSRDLPFTL